MISLFATVTLIVGVIMTAGGLRSWRTSTSGKYLVLVGLVVFVSGASELLASTFPESRYVGLAVTGLLLVTMLATVKRDVLRERRLELALFVAFLVSIFVSAVFAADASPIVRRVILGCVALLATTFIGVTLIRLFSTEVRLTSNTGRS